MRLSDAQSTLRVAMAELCADVVLGGIRECGEEGQPLTERQARVLLRNALMEHATNVEAAQRMLEFDDQMFRDREEEPSDPGDRSS